MEYQNLLVFLEFPEPTRPSIGLLESLSYMDITLVGFHSLPESGELTTDQRASIESTLEEVATGFEERGIRVEQHVVTGKNLTETRNQWASRDEIDGVLIPGDINTVGRVLVGVRGARHVDKMADFVDLIDRERIIHITLLNVAPESKSNQEASTREALETLKSALTDRGVNPAAVDLRIDLSDDPERQLVKVARNYDLTVLGKTQEPGLKQQVFGPISDYIIERSNSAVLTLN